MYALIHNNQIQVGPRQWNYAFFKDYLEEEGLDYSAISRSEPVTPIFAQDYKVLPVTAMVQPACDHTFEQYAGPYWTINDDHITGYYDVVPQSFENIKSMLKAQVTDSRYKVETGGCQFTFSDDTSVTLYTSREDRGSYMEALQIMPDDASVVFKFPGAIFKSVTKTELVQMVGTGAAHIQSAFAWESEKHAEIDAAQSLDSLKALNIVHPLLVNSGNTVGIGA